MRILYVTTVGGMMKFFNSFIRKLINEGHTVDIACNENITGVPVSYDKLNCKIYNISCTRSPFCRSTVAAVSEIRKIVEANDYDIVHCHSPIAAMCTRLACRPLRKKNGVKVIYTAHGFHFFKGAPLKNWLLYFPIEKICSYFTDVLITINKEDYYFATRRMNAKKTVYVPGVGIDTVKFHSARVDRIKKRREIGVPKDAILLLSIGELNENKNHKTVIKAISQIKNDNIHYVIAGEGHLESDLKALARGLGIEKRVHFLGYRGDIAELCKISDYYIHPSYREGLPVSIMEAMASGLPILASDTRGCSDLTDDDGGILFDPHSISQCKESIDMLSTMDTETMGKHNSEKVESYSTENINSQMIDIYRAV